ncbi:MAG: helix-turn-helix transcriptional regulator [Lachnospiraceae bacterium]|nr:helix-turn-helix transcriptional regulator [Lachnospiraceae bacterium]
MKTANSISNSQKNVARFTDSELEAMGRRIREAREKKGIKQIDLALQLAIGKNQMYRIESGQVPCKVEYLYEIAQVLDVSLDYLFFGNKDSETSSENDKTVQEIVTLCVGKDAGALHKALCILRAFFA